MERSGAGQLANIPRNWHRPLIEGRAGMGPVLSCNIPDKADTAICDPEYPCSSWLLVSGGPVTL